MPLAIALSPEGHLVADELAEANSAFQPTDEPQLREKLAQGDAAILLWLAERQDLTSLPLSALFWRSIAGLYLTQYCQHGGHEGMTIPDEQAWSRNLLDAPPMRGVEFLCPVVLSALWQRLDEAIRTNVAANENWFKETLPHWHLIGRVTLHLAENKKNLERPFAFLATYINGLNAEGKPRHLPLQQAVKEYAGAQNRTALLTLLEPISLAAQKSDWMREMTDGGHIYKPQAWTAGQALQFLREVPTFEASGLSVRIPDWWKASGPPRPQVSVQLGDNAVSGLHFGSLMKFEIEVTLDGEKLTAEELKALQTAEGLVLVKGKWVEVDAEKLQAVLKHWQQARALQFQGGISFLQAMRLLSGMPLESKEAMVAAEDLREWSTISPGPALQAVLDSMRDPSNLQEFAEHPELKATLRPYQLEGVNWLRFMTRLGLGACLADDMGLGKTIQVLALLLKIKRLEPEGGASLLVAPASLLQNWSVEAAKFAPALNILIAHGSGDQPEFFAKLARGKTQILDRIDLVITSYGMISRLEVIRERNWRMVIVDEAQVIKNAASAQSRAVRGLKGTVKIALTGTPVENRVEDLWALFDLINPGFLGTAAGFGRFVKSLSKGGAVNYGPLRKRVQPYILRRLKTDKKIINDLPDKIEMNAWCLLTKPQAMLYQQAVQTLIKTLAEVDKEARSGIILSVLMTFKQICNHPAQHSGDTHYETAQSGKFLRLQELCQSIAERQEKVLLFTQFTEIIPALRSLMRSVFGRDGLVLTGSTNVKERQDLVSEFQRDGGPPFFILSLKAGGTGLTLTAATHVIHFDRWWNPAVENQATDRAYRIGQKRNVLVHKFVCRGTLEEKIDALITRKSQLADAMMAKGDELPLTEMSDAELIDFVSLDINAAAT